MDLKKRLGVAFIFLAGFVVTGISIARLVTIKRASETNFTCERAPSHPEAAPANILPN